jgi:hypothetical protein
MNEIVFLLSPLALSFLTQTTCMQFDRVLCDVPCTGDGTLRKNIDVLMYRLFVYDMLELFFPFDWCSINVENCVSSTTGNGERAIRSICIVNRFESHCAALHYWFGTQLVVVFNNNNNNFTRWFSICTTTNNTTHYRFFRSSLSAE